MPEISRFFGIVIRMFVETGDYQGHVAVYAIDEVMRLAGSFAARQERFVLAWIEIHLDELREDWRLLQEGRTPLRIEALR